MVIDESLLVYIKTNINIIVDIIKVISLMLLTYYTNFKLTNTRKNINLKKIILIIVAATIYVLIKKEINNLVGIISIIITTSLIYSTKNMSNNIVLTTISLSVNYILSTVSVIISFLINVLLNINNDYVLLIIITIVHIIILYGILKIKKIKYGISFLKERKQNENLDIIVLNISIITLVSVVMFANLDITQLRNVFAGFLIFSVIMFITIQKSLQLYYKQKLLVQELEQTKQELADKNKEIENLEKENITISKRNHTIDHKQKSLELKIAEMMSKSEISKEEAGEVRERIKQISKHINKEKTAIELDKTGIPEIDDMLKYMQTECNKNKIDFELQIKGNIHYMINNLISKEDLETLLADHIKNAIIAIEHTDNVNRSILVRIGKIDENYGLYIYDSGI